MSDVLVTNEGVIKDEVPPFTMLKKLEVYAATPSDKSVENTKINSIRNYPFLHRIPEFQRVKGKDKAIALVAGGPSVKQYVDDIKQFKTIMLCGSANDWAMEQGIVPTYSVVCDPDPISANYFTKLDTEVKYFVATCCDPSTFDKIAGDHRQNQIIKWHCHSQEQHEILNKQNVDVEYHHAVGGGSTVGLRSLSIAIVLGYSNIHMFGYDSCLGPNEEHHAYEFNSGEKIGKIFKLKLGNEEKPDESRTFSCEGYQLAQADQFKEYYYRYRNLFTPTIYGDGFLAAMYTKIQEDLREVDEKAKAIEVKTNV